MKALKISTQGVREVVDFDNETAYSVIRSAVGGWIECIRIPSMGVEMWVNEEGKLADNPIINPIATALWVDNYGKTDVTVGDVIITGPPNGEGDSQGLTEEQLATLLAYDKTVNLDGVNVSDYIGFTVTSL
jgi:hypothetical protein